LRCWQNADGCKARDEGRSSDYEAEERNDADAAFCRNPEGRGLSGRSALSLGLPRGSGHWLHLASRIPSRIATVATAWDLIRGSLSELEQFNVSAITRPERYLLLVQTGDELLDYRQAVKKYRGARQVVIEGGDHRFRNFSDYVPMILEFAAE